MVIINPSIATQPAAFNRPAGPAPILPTDRVLMAVVLGQKAGHLYELASGNLRLMAESQTPLRQGEQLQLQVTGFDEAKRPQLEILSRQSQNLGALIKASLPQQQTLNHLSSALLAGFRQGNPQITLATEDFIRSLPLRQQLTDPNALRQLIRNSGLFLESHLAKGEVISTDLKTALLKLARQLENAAGKGAGNTSAKADAPLSGKLSTAYGPGLQAHADRANVAMSGLSNQSANADGNTPLTRTPDSNAQHRPATQAYRHASGTAQTTPELPGDLRPQARIPLQQVQLPAQPEQLARHLLSMVQGGLARQEAHQLLHLQSSDPQQQQYVMELPVRDRDGIDVWQLHIDRRRDDENQKGTDSRQSQDKAEHQWTITLNFDFPGMGPVKSIVKHSESGLSVQFIAQRPETEAMIKGARGELQQRLAEQGIEDATINSQLGNCAGPDSPLHRQHLLEDKA